jgi:hypothetical protein
MSNSMLPAVVRLALGSAAMLALVVTVRAAQGGPNVAIIAAESGITGPYFTDPQAKIQASGLFGVVDVIDGMTTTPTLAQLQAYDAVITWSDYDYSNSTLLGDVLADYVDAGGGVVVATFSQCDLSVNRELQGRWATGGYPIIVPMGGTWTGPATLGAIQVPGHPLLAGVTNFDGGPYAFRPSTTAVTTGSQVIASWSDGKILVATHGTMPGRVDLGFFPPSTIAASHLWISGTDGDKLLANALFYAAGGGNTNVYCSGDGTGTACPCGNAGIAGNGCASSVSAGGAHLGSFGVASISGDSVVLTASLMPNSSALYFQGTTQTAAGVGLAFGDGLRCASGSIVRLKTTINVAGTSQFPGPGDAHVSVKGMIAAPGTRTYQVWYRNAAAYCTPSTFNLTNGVQLAWSS